MNKNTKLIDTNDYCKKKITLEDLKPIIENLSHTEDIWVSMYDSQSSNENCVQIHSETEEFEKEYTHSSDKGLFGFSRSQSVR